MPSDFRAIIQAQLNDESVENEVKAIGNKHKIVFNNISFDRTALSNAIQSALNGQNININLGNANFNTQNLARQAEQIGNTIGRQLTQQINANLSRITVQHSPRHIENMQLALASMGVNGDSIAEITQDLAKMDIQIQNIKTHFSQTGAIQINVSGIDKAKNAVNILKSVRAEEKEIAEGKKIKEWKVYDLGTNVTQNFAKQESQLQKNTAAAIKYSDQLATLNSRFTGEESKSRLFNANHITEFNAALQNVYNTIAQLETATAEQSTVLKANISSQINAVNLLGQSFYNVELAERSDETQIQKNTVAVTGYLSKLEAITAKYSADSNKPIINPTNLSIVNSELDKVLNHVANLETATSKEAVTIKSNIDSEINSLNLLIQSLQRAENAEKVNAQQLAKNEAEIAKYKSTIEKLSYDAFNPNATKPLRDDGNINQLQSAFMQAIMSAEQLRNADSATFTEMRSNVESEINSLKLLITSFQNAEYAASQLRAKPVETVKAEQLELLRVFIADINKAGISLNQFENVKIDKLKGMLQGVTNADGLKQYLNTLSVAKAEFKALRQEQAQFANATEVQIAINKMETWLLKNQKAAKAYGTEIRNLINSLKQMQAQGGVLPTELKRITNSFTEMKTAAAAAGLTGRTFFQQILGAAKSLGRYFGVSTVVYRTFGTIKNGIKDIVDLDTALVDLKKTTDGTEAQLNSFYYTANESAKKLGVTTKEIISASADWSRLGYSLKDAETMAQVSAKFEAISPGVDMQKAQDGLVSAMKAFNIEANDALDGIASKINAIGNSQSVSNGDIIEFLTRSSSAMKEANNTLEETIALGTAATEITRDASSVGNALKTVSMRIRGYDEETEEFVGGIEELSGDIADLTKSAEHPLGISLFTNEAKTEFKSTTQLLRDVSEIYDELTDKQQAQLLEKLAGKRQGQILAAILNNFSAVESSLETMKNSAGSADREMGIIEQSIEYKINRLKETGVGVFQNLFQRQDIGVFVDGLTLVLNAVDGLSSAFGTLGTIIATVGVVKFFKNLDQLKNLGMLSTALKTVGQGATDINLVTTAVKGLTAENTAAVLATTALSDAEKMAILATTGLTAEEAQSALTAAEMTASMDAESAAILKLRSVMYGTANTFKGIFATIKAHPIIAAITAIGIAASVTMAIINGVKQSNDEMMRKASENTETLKDSLKDIDNYKDKIAELQDSLKNDNLSQHEATEKRKELLAIQDELIKKYGREKDVIDSITSAIKGETDALDGLSQSAAKQYLGDNQSAISHAQDFFDSRQDFYVHWGLGLFDDVFTEESANIVQDWLNNAKSFTYKDSSLESGKDQYIHFTGTRDEIVKHYNDFYDYIEHYLEEHNHELAETSKNQLKNLLTNISDARNYILHNEDNSYDNNTNVIDSAAKSALVSSYSDIYAQYLAKQEEYQNALAKGDQDIITQAYQDVVSAYQTLVNGITYDVGNVKTGTIKNWLSDVHQEFVQANKEQPLIIDIQAELKSPESFASQIKEMVTNSGYTTEDISSIIAKGNLGEDLGTDQALYDNIQGYVTMWNEVAKVTGVAEISVEDYIAALSKLGVITQEVGSDFKQSFGLSKDQNKELKAIFSDADKLNKVYKDLKNGKTVDINDVAELVANFSDLEQYVDWTDEKFGNLAEGIEKVIKERPQDFIKELQEIDTSNMSDEAKRYIQSLIVALQNINVELETTEEFLEHIKKSIKGVSSSISTLIGFSKEIDENGVLSLSSIDTILADDTYASLRPYINDMENMKTAIASLTKTQKIAYEDLYNEQLRVYNPDEYHKAIEEKEKADENYFKNSVERIQDEVKNFKNLYGIDAENWEQISTAKQDILQNTNAELLFKQNKLINDFANYYNTDLTNFKNTAQAKAAILDNFRESQVYKQVLDTITADDTKSGITIDTQTGRLITYANPEVRNKINSLLAASGLTYSDYENYMAYGTFTSKGNDALSKRLDELLKTYSISPTNWEDMTKNIKSTGSSTSSKSKNDYIDWIERRLKKLAQTTKEVFSSVSDYISFTGKNNQLSKAIKSIADEISANEKAYQAYMDEANALGLDSTWTWWLQNGGYSVQDISSFSDDLKDKVSRYKELYEKAMDCKNAITDLKKTEKEYAEQMLSNIDKYYDNKINRAKNSVDYYNSLDTDTQFIGKNYGGLADNYNKQITETQNKAKQLQETLNSLVSQGLIKEGSDEWYEWVSKIDQCTIQVRELTKSLHELAVEQFNNIKEQYDNQLKAIEYTSKQYDNKIKKLEEQGYMANLQHYAGLKSVQQQNITLLEKEAKALQKSLDEAIENGDIQKYSKEWYSAKQAIDDVNNSIDEGKIKLIEYGNTMREIEWGYFDYLQDRISQVTDEADFLIDVMSNSKLFNDNGNITAKGKSSIGLHAQNHNIYLAQAQQYATEIKSINKLLANDPNNKKLIERREELLKLQQQSIQATQKEKKAIVDLVKEGIDLQLKSLKKLIDEYKSSLDNAKNLYEYQKKINDKTTDISKLQKQLMAYEGDNSEESRARIQKLQTDLKSAQEDLQETEYDQFISDTKSLLDNLYEDYEESMNKRLENESAIWHEMVGTVNQSKTEINAEIQRSANTVGYTLSKSITDIWSNPNSINKIVVANSTSFNEKLSSINNVLGAINANVSSMVSASGGTFKKYATGGLVDYTGIAHVDGTPTRPELVLNANDTQNFLKFNDEIKRLSSTTRFSGYNFAGLPIPTPHISDISSVFGNIAKSSISGNSGVNIEHFEIAIDKVQDYNDFVSQLKNDKKVERMIQDMTIGRINGNNSFTKHKYNW